MHRVMNNRLLDILVNPGSTFSMITMMITESRPFTQLIKIVSMDRIPACPSFTVHVVTDLRHLQNIVVYYLCFDASSPDDFKQDVGVP